MTRIVPLILLCSAITNVACNSGDSAKAFTKEQQTTIENCRLTGGSIYRTGNIEFTASPVRRRVLAEASKNAKKDADKAVIEAGRAAQAKAEGKSSSSGSQSRKAAVSWKKVATAWKKEGDEKDEAIRDLQDKQKAMDAELKRVREELAAVQQK